VEGLVLRRPLEQRHILTDARLTTFLRQAQAEATEALSLADP
jgi:hypothetical protein